MRRVLSQKPSVTRAKYYESGIMYMMNVMQTS